MMLLFVATVTPPTQTTLHLRPLPNYHHWEDQTVWEQPLLLTGKTCFHLSPELQLHHITIKVILMMICLKVFDLFDVKCSFFMHLPLNTRFWYQTFIIISFLSFFRFVQQLEWDIFQTAHLELSLQVHICQATYFTVQTFCWIFSAILTIVFIILTTESMKKSLQLSDTSVKYIVFHMIISTMSNSLSSLSDASSSSTTAPVSTSSMASSSSNNFNSSMARFCHECGVPFPGSHVRFCCECGVRRLYMWWGNCFKLIQYSFMFLILWRDAFKAF